MSDYHYLTADLTTDEDKGIIPLGGASYGPSLNGGGTCTGTLAPQLTDADVVAPGKTALYVYRDGKLAWGGIIWRIEPRGQELALTAAGFKSYGDMRALATRLGPYVYADPLTIAQALWNWMQDQPEGDIGVTVGTETTNGKVKVGTPAEPFTCDWWDAKFINEYVRDLEEREDGFDSDVFVTVDNDGNRQKRLTFGYPRLGRRQHNLRLETGVNVIATVPQTLDATTYATDVFALGAGEGRNRLVRAVHKRGTGYPRIDKAVTFSDVTAPDQLLARARTELAVRSNIATLTQVVIKDHPACPLGGFQAGDDIYARLHDGWTNFEGWVRVMGYQVQPSDAGEPITLDVARADQFVYGPGPDVDLSGSSI